MEGVGPGLCWQSMLKTLPTRAGASLYSRASAGVVRAYGVDKGHGRLFGFRLLGRAVVGWIVDRLRVVCLVVVCLFVH